ncbi:unnamed protein product [Trichobilharzia regenti]|nr:unnamed protein product [Trichobilharzia regenti]
MKSRASSGPVTPSPPQGSSQHYQHLYRSKASTPDTCKSSNNNSLRRQTVIKHFPKIKSTNYLNEDSQWPGGDNKHKHTDSVYSPLPDNRLSYDEKVSEKLTLFVNELNNPIVNFQVTVKKPIITKMSMKVFHHLQITIHTMPPKPQDGRGWVPCAAGWPPLPLYTSRNVRI